MTTVTFGKTAPDAELWRASARGSRDAFAEIVRRYQTLVASIAYSRTGSVSASQDLAQETFVVAWTRLTQLRDPELLRSWLCGIVRNLSANYSRTSRRVVPLDAIEEPALDEDDPETQAISREEEALVWRALEALPDHYREPLVLFYREHQSIADVAIQLELSQDTVKQRLSRGRAMLRAEVADTVATALSRSRPSAAFTGAVMAAIAAGTPSTAAASTVVVAAGKAAPFGVGPVVGPAAGLATSWAASRLVGLNARSNAEKALVHEAFARAMAFVLPAVALLVAFITFGGPMLRSSPWTLIGATTLWTVGLVGYLIRLGNRSTLEIHRVRAQNGTSDEALGRPAVRTFASRWSFLGLPLFAYGSTGVDAGARSPGPVRAWIAVGDVAISPFIALGGLAIAPFAAGGITIGVLSFSIAGIGIGIVAVGSLALGYWAFGAAALGWQAAAGGAAIARDFALGVVAKAAVVNDATAASWFRDQWFAVPVQLFVLALPLLIAAAIVVPLTVLARRAWAKRSVGAANR